jgi:aminopeptidase N
VEPILDKVKIRDAAGKDLPFAYNPASGVIRLEVLPKGNHILNFEYSGIYPEKAIPNYQSVIAKDFFQILKRWQPIPWGDRYDGELTIITPENMLSTSCGIMVGEKIERGKRIRYFRSEKPISGSFQIIGGKYREITAKSGAVKISIFVQESLPIAQEAWMDYCRKTLEGCIEFFGFYPFSELKVVQLPLAPDGGGWGGYQTMSLILGDDSWKAPPLEGGYPNFVAHEIVHQYFGGVAEYSEEDQGTYVSEGATEFSSALIVNSFAPSPILEKRKAFWFECLKKVPPDQDVPMASATYENNSSYLTFAYNKFPLFLSVLRDKIGDGKLRSIFRNFLKRFYFEGAFGVNDFLEEIRKESEQNSEVERIVNSWIRQKGIPASQIPDILSLSVVASTERASKSSLKRKPLSTCLTPSLLREDK